LMLLLYSLGLSIPFVVSAIIIDKLKTTFDFIKRNYAIINKICGILLIVIGILMMTGLTGVIVNFLS
ncbi:MAG: cytochrome c biogenesis protein CcdA, partial [Clostridia bacterium]|nr:cytochrome c biogenesis protein CcdA [Clostridia bacterium]